MPGAASPQPRLGSGILGAFYNYTPLWDRCKLQLPQYEEPPQRRDPVRPEDTRSVSPLSPPSSARAEDPLLSRHLARGRAPARPGSLHEAGNPETQARAREEVGHE